MEKLIYSSKRTTCPDCGSSRGFAPFIGYERSGYCHSCTVTLYPNGKQKANTGELKQHKAAQDKAPALNQYQRSLLLKRLFNESMANRLNNNFAKFMIEVLGEDLANRSLFYYGIGSDNDNNTVFWFRDYDGELTHCKIVSYGTDGKRLKGDKSNIRFIDYSTGEIKHLDALNGYSLSSGEYPKYEFLSGSKGYDTTHFYGEWLLNPNFKHLNLIQGGSYYCDLTAPIIAVESEKTAFLCGLLYPKLLFIATGGANGLTAPKVQHLLNRNNIFIAFDNDLSGIESMAKVQQLIPNAIALNPAILGITEQKGDLFDYLVQDKKRLNTALEIYNDATSFNFHIDLACDVTAPASVQLKKAVA